MRYLFIVLIITNLIGCRQKQYGAFIVAGKIDNATGQRIALQELPFTGEQPVILDSATLKKNGTFELRAMAKEEGLYRLVLESGHEVLLVNDGNDIKVRVDLDNYRNYTVEGSPASMQLHNLLESLLTMDAAFFAEKRQFDSAAGGVMNDSLMTVLNAKRDRALKERRDLIMNFIRKSNSPAAICYALGQFDEYVPVASLKQATDDAAARFPSHSGLARFKSILAVQMQSQRPAYALLDQPAPEIRLPTPAGDTLALSSLRGRYVLVDFWASWCGPCRKENPNVVAAFNTYQAKNFTILGVSLDTDQASWEAAIRQDSLNWPHISDLKSWNSSVVSQYQFNGIPFNVLLDPSGKIIASELRGEALHRKLAAVLK